MSAPGRWKPRSVSLWEDAPGTSVVCSTEVRGMLSFSTPPPPLATGWCTPGGRAGPVAPAERSLLGLPGGPPWTLSANQVTLFLGIFLKLTCLLKQLVCFLSSELAWTN